LALQPDASGAAIPQAPAFLRFGSWIGADRDGNPFVTAAVTEQTARIQADHALRALGNAASRIGRSLTISAVLLAGGTIHRAGPAVHEEGTGPGLALAELDPALPALTQAPRALLGELMSRSPGEPFRTFLLHTAQRLHATRLQLTGEDERQTA